jgi:hypothetical protein
MSNTLTYIQRQGFSAMQNIAAEQTGAIFAVNTSFDSKKAALNDYVDIPVAPVATVTSFSPGVALPTPTDQTAGRVRFQITNTDKTVPRALTGEEIQSLMNAETDKDWARQNIEQMARALRNTIETALCLKIKQNASRAVGTAGTNPFLTDIGALGDARQIFTDNGASGADLQAVLPSSHYTAMGKLGIVQQAMMAGSDAERRSGIIGGQNGFKIRQSAGIALHTKGTETTSQIGSGGELAGQTTLSIDGGAGTSTILAGDIVTFGSGGGTGTADANKYCVTSGGTATGASSGDIVIGNPGLRIAHVDNDEMTIGGNYTPTLCFERNAVVLIVRPTFIPPNPNINQMTFTDPVTGLTFVLLEISEYGQIVWEMHAAWGCQVVQSEFVSLVLG